MNKKDLIRKNKDIEQLTSEEKSELIGLVNTQKRYGLVWEEKPEEVEEELRGKLPVLVEVKEKRILSEPLIEADSIGETDLFKADSIDEADSIGEAS